MRRQRTRALVGVLVAAMLGLFAATVAAPASPALANSGPVVCFPIIQSGQIVGWKCVEIPVQTCEPPCGLWSIDPHEDIVQPIEEQFEYLDQLTSGMSLVGAAALERDPAAVQRLLDEAQQRFLGAARSLGDTRITGVSVGVPDLRNNQVLPFVDPWLIAAGTDVGNGIGAMQQALRDPDPDPWIGAGMTSFVSANQHLSSHR